MKSDELKLRIITYINNLIDQYIPDTNIFERFKNSTVKYWVNQNAGKLDNILKIFQDCTGDIDTNSIKQHYIDTLFINGQMEVDIHSIIPDDMSMIKSILPNKIVVFNENDLNKIFS